MAPNGWWLRRLAAFELVVIIVTTNLKTHFGVHSKSLGQVTCSHVLGSINFHLSNFIFPIL
jgi:hypothetical protein